MKLCRGSADYVKAKENGYTIFIKNIFVKNTSLRFFSEIRNIRTTLAPKPFKIKNNIGLLF